MNTDEPTDEPQAQEYFCEYSGFSEGLLFSSQS